MLYNNTTLIAYCLDNHIELLDDYTNIKINRDYYIRGNCKSILETCNKIFNKNFRQLVKTGPYCLICAIENGKQKFKLKCKYNLSYLIEFCKENNIILNDEYTSQDINRDTIIKGICLTDDCNNNFNRPFRELIKINGYCFDCSKENGKTKIIETNLTKYGCISSMQNEIVKNKQKNTILKKYGVEHISQLECIKQQKKEKSLEKYGTEFVLQSEIVRNKGKETNKIKYGFEIPQQNIDIKNKTQETIFKKYGYKGALKNPEVKQKMIENNMLKYGVPHHSQNAEIAEKMCNSAYCIKQYTFPSGKIINYQGYENFAFDELINLENILEDDILTNRQNVPEIWYTDKTGKLRRHFVDIYIKSQNRCIEVKSTWTNQEKNNVFEKKHSAINLGYNYEIWIF